MMNPHSLIPPDNPLGYPAPFWFMEVLKVLGFSLHVAMMNIWYAGAPIAAVFALFGRGNGRTVGHHIARALPFIIATGINFGIIPLLFLQVVYNQFFYPATIIIAWPWFAVFWFVLTAYFLTYLYRLSVDRKFPGRPGTVAICIAAVLFVVVGFIFANGLSLTTNIGGWWELFRNSNVAGAAAGLSLNTNDPTLIPRWLFMFGLALTTTAVFVSVDAAFMSGRHEDDYRRYAGRFSFVLYSIGLLWFVGFGSWYILGTREFAVREMLANPYMRILLPLTAVSPGLPWLLMLFERKMATRKIAGAAIVAQFGVIALNAVSRQWLQNRELARYADLAARPEKIQWGGLILFVTAFVFGLVLCGWMIWKIVEVNRREAAENA